MSNSTQKYAAMATVLFPYHCMENVDMSQFRGESWWHRPAFQDRRRPSECLPDFKCRRHNRKKGKR